MLDCYMLGRASFYCVTEPHHRLKFAVPLFRFVQTLRCALIVLKL